MDVMLRGRGADIGVRAPLWLVRVCGAILAFALLAVADTLGILDLFGSWALVVWPLAIVFGAVVAPSAIGELLWWAGALLLLLYLVVGYTPLTGALAPNFVRRDENRGPVDAIVVMSGSINEAGRLSGQVLDRLLSAVAEARKLQATTLALSVVVREVDGRRVTSEADQRELISTLAPGLELRFVEGVTNTHDEAQLFAALAATHGWRKVAVVTSPLHSRRACRAIEVAGLSVECVPAAPRDYALKPLNQPSARIRAFKDVVYESLATMLYLSRGWM